MRMKKFQKYFLYHREKDFYQNVKFTNENDMFCAWRDFKKERLLVGLHMINETFKPKISSIFHIEHVNDG